MLILCLLFVELFSLPTGLLRNRGSAWSRVIFGIVLYILQGVKTGVTDWQEKIKRLYRAD
jgi:hypothetical protein